MRFLFALLTVAALCGIASAQHVCRGRPVIVTAPAYHAPAVAVVAPVVAVKAVAVAIQPDYYYSVSDGYRDSLLADAIAFRVLQAQALQAASGGTGRVTRETPPVPRYKEPAATPAAPATMPRATSDGIPAALARLIEGRCVTCHNAPGKNGIDLSDPGRLTRSEWLECQYQVAKNKMPKGGKPLSDEELVLFDEPIERSKATK